MIPSDAQTLQIGIRTENRCAILCEQSMNLNYAKALREHETS